MADALWRKPATELSALIEAGALSPRDLLEQCLDRRRRIDPAINAHVFIDEAGARRAADESAGRAQAGRRLSPLDGLPVTIKDNIFVAGMPTTWGSRLFAEFTPDVDEVPVARLRQAGAVIVGKTNTPELALAPVTENRLFGVTRNPWRTDLTPGGSSGGAVASVAAGVFPLAVATDAGGSIRRPASYAGVVGFRPSSGRVPRVNGFPPLAGDFQVIGTIARTVDDVAALYRVIAGPDPQDRQSMMAPSPAAGSERLRILFIPRAGSGGVDSDVRTAVEDAAAALAAIGHRIEEGPAPYDVDEIDGIWSVLTAVGVRRVLDGVADWKGNIDDALAALAERGGAVTGTEYLAALDRVACLRRAFAAATADFDAILTPTSASLPWPADRRFPAEIDGRAATPRAAAVFATVVNAVGHPAISVPGAPSRDGLPVGVQLIGRFGDDERVLALARDFERARPWRHRWPALAEAGGDGRPA